MSRSFFAKLHRRFGTRLSGAERYERAHAKQTELVGWLGLAAVPFDCAVPCRMASPSWEADSPGSRQRGSWARTGVASTVLEARKTYGRHTRIA